MPRLTRRRAILKAIRNAANPVSQTLLRAEIDPRYSRCCLRLHHVLESPLTPGRVPRFGSGDLPPLP